MSRDELLETLGTLRNKMKEGRNMFRQDVCLTNSFNRPPTSVQQLTTIIGSLIEGKSLKDKDWLTVKQSINPYEEFRQKLINFEPASLDVATVEMVKAMMEEWKDVLVRNTICCSATALHVLLFDWLHVVLQLKDLHVRSSESLQKGLFQTSLVNDVSIHLTD